MPQVDRPPAVIIGVSWANGLGLIRSLSEAGVPVVALDPDPRAIGLFSRSVAHALVCPDPGEEESAFLDFMERIARWLGKPGVLFLTRDQDVSTVSRNQAQLEPSYHIPFARWEVLGQIVDKRGQYAVALEAGIPLPVTRFPNDEAEAIAAARAVPYPALVKPAYHAGFWEQFGAKGFVANDAGEALAQVQRGVAHGYQMMIQEIIPGDADLLYTYGSYLNPEGEPLAQFTGRKLRQHPRMFGTCRLGECYPAPKVAELGLKLLRALGFWGISQVEFKLDPRDGHFKLMEVNARNYQWQHLATVCGANLAYAAYRDVLGQTVTPVSVPTLIGATSAASQGGDGARGGYGTRERTPVRGGKRWILAATDLAMTPAEILRGETSLWGWLGSWRGVAVDGIFSWRDPLPGLHYLSNKLYRAKARPDQGQETDPTRAKPGPGRQS
jgi:predicted ATP-grasp superfamily ATP-dependent carboligase